MMPKAIPLIALGGAIGAGLRYTLLQLNPFGLDYSFMIIMLENISGSLLLGLLAGLIIRSKINSWPWAPLLGTGVLGSFTTFSALMTDTINLASVNLLFMGAYLLISISGGLLAAVVGLKLAGTLLPRRGKSS